MNGSGLEGKITRVWSEVAAKEGDSSAGGRRRAWHRKKLETGRGDTDELSGSGGVEVVP